MATTTPTVTLDDLIGCTICGDEVTIRNSGSIEGHRVCMTCFDPAPVFEGEPPF